MICKNLSVENGRLHFAGQDTVALAKNYGTPLMLFDGDRFSENVNIYKSAMAEAFGEGSMPLFASKALCFTGIYRMLKKEGVGADVVSSGELYTALSAGFPAEKLFFHGNNKTDDDIVFGVSTGVGYFVCDNSYELRRISEIALEKGVVQNILIRLTPSVDAHTFEAVSTGKLDSKFGVAIETGAADALVSEALSSKGVRLCGFHSHIGSQIFESEPFVMAARTMADYCVHVKKEFALDTQVLDLGGGIGVRYLDSDPEVSVRDIVLSVGNALREVLDAAGLPMPRVFMEPGRSLVADAGVTLYSVGAVKEIAGVKNYVSVNGGMADNPRFALYGAPYTVMLANRASEECDYRCTVAGRCCESGDVIQEGVMIPRPERGDVLAVLTTGAYNYSMASHYNRLAKPPIVVLKDGESRVAVRRETLKDLLSCDVVLELKEEE